MFWYAELPPLDVEDVVDVAAAAVPAESHSSMAVLWRCIVASDCQTVSSCGETSVSQRSQAA